MTEDFTTEALHYLLDELDPERRAAFAERLSRDPVAAEAFKACADSLAQFALNAAPAAALSEPDRRVELAVILAAAASTPRPTALPVRTVTARRWLWPIAAAVLLGLNFAQLFLSSRCTSTSPVPGNLTENHDPLAPRGPAVAGGGEGGADGTARKGGKETGHTPGTEGHPPDSGPLSPESRVSTQLARLDSLQREYQDLKKSRDSLNAEYDQAILRLTQRAITEQGISRLAAMELVDANSFARGDRKGLMSLAKEILTQPGVVTDPGNSQGGVGSTGVPGGVGNTGFGPIPTPVPTPAPETPYAWSVFDEKESQGYLNLYNLPRPTTDQSLIVWIKPADSQEFKSVGEVPSQFYGKSGAVSYTLPPGSPTPVEIMITLEPRANPPAKPTGGVVLRGP